jgi:hypothetical protein
MHLPFVSRRSFLAYSALMLTGLAADPGKRAACSHRGTRGPHPTPRPGIDASKVRKESELKGPANMISAFNEVREIPHIVDGIRCQCGCADWEGHYSLLSCYEGPHAMAQMCDLCQGHGRYAYRLHKAGKTLDEIRDAIDARYGS